MKSNNIKRHRSIDLLWYIDVEGGARDVVVAPLDNQHIVATVQHGVGDVVVLVAPVPTSPTAN